MSKDNDLKIKEILDDLEEEIDDSLQEEKEDIVDTVENEEIETSESDELEKEISEEETEEESIDTDTKQINADDFEESEKEVIEVSEIEEELEEDKEYIIKETVINTDIKQIGDYIIEKLLKYKYVLILDFSVFLLLFFLIPTIILEVKPYIWMSIFLVFTILPSMAFYMKNKFKEKQIMIGFVFFFICILCILDQCTITDLYGITSHGTLDKTPAWIDALLVTMIIVFFQYIGILIVNVIKLLRKKKTRK